MSRRVSPGNVPHGHGAPPKPAMAMGAWLALARQRGVTDREYRLGVELWSYASTGPYQGKPRCWREGEGWAYRVWPRIEPKDTDPPEKQANALMSRMGCKRRKVEQALSGLCKKALICRVPRPGGPPGKRERFNLQADTILLVPDTALKAASPRVSTTESAQSGQSDTRHRAEPNQLSHSTSLVTTNPPSKLHSTQKRSAGTNADSLIEAVGSSRDETQRVSVTLHGTRPAWGDDGPGVDDLTDAMIDEVLKAWPNLVASQDDRKVMIAAYRILLGFAPRSTSRNVERLRELGMDESNARKVAGQFEGSPHTLRKLIAGVQQDAKEGRIANPAAVLLYRINQSHSKHRDGDSWAL
jgi:hypothetical protein